MGHIWVLLWLVFQGAGVALVVGIAIWGYLFWDRRYHGATGAEAGYQPTGEVFTDPTSHRLMRVWFNPRTGRRQYREEG